MTDTATRTEPKLSVIPKGGWRNRWSIDRLIELGSGRLVGPGEFVSDRCWPSREVAEQKAHDVMNDPWVRKADPSSADPIWLGCEFFPDT